MPSHGPAARRTRKSGRFAATAWSRVLKEPADILDGRKPGRQQVVDGMIDVGMRIAPLDERRLCQVVVSKMTRPANRFGAIRSGAVNEKGRKGEQITLLDFDRFEIAVGEAVDLAKSVNDFGRDQSEAMARRDDFERSQSAVNVMKRHPDDDRIERALHAPPVLVGEYPPIDFLGRQVTAVEEQHGPRRDIGKSHTKTSQQIENSRIESQTVQRNEMLNLLAAVRKTGDILAKEMKERVFEIWFGRRTVDGLPAGRQLLLEDADCVLAYVLNFAAIKHAAKMEISLLSVCARSLRVHE